MYNIGLDIGTGSVGWCLTDENGYLLKVIGKVIMATHIEIVLGE